MDSLYLFIYIYLFIIGSCVASFANVAIYRIPRGISIAKGRSYCESCQSNLQWYDLMPVVSYILLKGKCRYCQNHISFKHFLFECFGGLLFMLSFYRFGLTIETIIVFLIVMVLVVIAIIDYQTMDIYLSTILTLLILVIIYQTFVQMDLMTLLIGGLCISIPMFILNMIIPSSFGFGDIELMFVSGLLLGWQNNLLATFIGIIIGGIYAGYLLLSHKVEAKGHIAFGPFLIIGIITSLFYGTEIITWYLSLFIY